MLREDLSYGVNPAASPIAAATLAERDITEKDAPPALLTPTAEKDAFPSCSATLGRGTASSLSDSGHADDEDHTLKKRPWHPRVTPWSEILSHEYKGAGTEADPYIVSWLPNDRENPMSYKQSYKWFITVMAATGTLAVSMGSSMLSAAVEDIKKDFPGHNTMLYIMITGIYVLGFVVGPLLWAPCSEVFGRRAMFIFTYVPFTAFNAGACGAKDMNTLLIMRFFAGTFGSSTMTNSGGIIADMFAAHQRGLAMGVFSATPFLGPAIGPIAGGFLSEASSWHWVAAVIALFAALLTAIESLLLPETYAPVLLRKRAARLTKYTGRVYRYEKDAAKTLDIKALFLNQLKVPYKLLFTEPIVFVISLYMAIIYAILYMQFTAFPLVFQGYRGWSSGTSALSFIGVSVGAFIALAYIIFWVNPQYARQHAKVGYLPPEARLPSATIGAILLPVGLFIFAWTCVPKSIHWMGPISGTVPFGAGIVLVFLGVSNYLVDSYLLLAASVMAAGTVVRSILGVVFPLFTVNIYDAMGPHWAGTFEALLAVIFVPVPILLYRYGRRVRRMTKAGRDADDLGIQITKMMQAQAAARTAAAPTELEREESRRKEEEIMSTSMVAGDVTSAGDYARDEEAIIESTAPSLRAQSRAASHSEVEHKKPE